jgi:hypothetical protein
LSGSSQMCALFTIILCVLVYILISFFDAFEIKTFVKRFAFFIQLPILLLILALLTATVAINMRFVTTFGPPVWYIVMGTTGILAIPVALAYPLMEIKMRSIRLANFYPTSMAVSTSA